MTEDHEMPENRPSAAAEPLGCGTPWYQRTAVKIGGVSAAVVAVLGIGIGIGAAGNNAGAKPTPPTTAPETPGKPGTSETAKPTVERWLPSQGDYLSAEVTAGMRSEQITKLYTLKKGDFSTIEEFVLLDNYRNESWLNSGATRTDWLPFRTLLGSALP